MIFRELTPSGDWTFGKGIAGYARDEQAIELGIKTRLASWKGDCFFALEDHVDWASRLDKNQESALLNELQRVLLQSFGVVGINRFSGVLDRASRAYQVTYDIATIFGTSFINTVTLAAGQPAGG